VKKNSVKGVLQVKIFLLEVLEAKGFGRKWRSWPACLLLITSTCIIVNKELTKSIFHKRDLRQGDPLSPLLFMITTDVLAAMFTFADRRGAKIPECYKLFH
jgi:hypothetical protein